MTSRWVDVPRVLIDLCDDEEKTYTLPPDGPLDDLCDDEEKTDALPPDGRAGAGPLGAPAAQEVEHPPACSSRGRRRAPRAAARRWRAGGAVHAGAGVEPPGRVHPNARQDLMHGVMQRLRFRGTVRRLGRTRGVRKAWVKPTVLLVDVRACSCPAVADELPLETDHVWLKVGKQLADLQLLPGSVLEFDARVRWYKKAGGWDLALSHHTRLALAELRGRAALAPLAAVAGPPPGAPRRRPAPEAPGPPARRHSLLRRRVPAPPARARPALGRGRAPPAAAPAGLR